MPSLRRALLVSWVLLSLFTSVLPPWDLCWHREGALCAEVERAACCGDESAPSPADDSCNDCADFTASPALRAKVDRDAQGLTIHAPLAAVAAEAFPIAPLLLLAASSRAGSADWIDPGPPASTLSRPLRC